MKREPRHELELQTASDPGSGSTRRAARTGIAAVFLVGATSLAACAHHAATAARASDGATVEPPELARLREALRERDERLKQLESRLAMVEAEQRQFRYALEDARAAASVAEPPAPAKRASREPEPVRAPEREAERAEPRVVLRLHEERAALGTTRDPDTRSGAREVPLQDVPVISERLPVAPLPSATPVSLHGGPAFSSGAAQGVPAAARAVPQADATYSAALDALGARDFRNAALLFERFARDHAADPRFSKAVYWRAEALFALHSYAAARAGFEAYLAAAPRGDRAPDAWLKLGHARARSGDGSGAKAAFSQLRRDFPTSPAARMAAEEEP